jgi:putative membrane protein
MLQGELDMTGIRHVLAADTWWGIAAVLWIATGLVRTLAGVEKGTSYYLHNHVFWTKMALLGVILFLEVRPMLGLAGELERGNAA